MEHAVPHIRSYCQQRGLDFQVLKSLISEICTDDGQHYTVCDKNIFNQYYRNKPFVIKININIKQLDK